MRPVILLCLFALSSCSDFMEVRTIRPKVKKSKYQKQSDHGGFAGLGFEQPPDGDRIAIGRTPVEEVGYLPTKVGDDVEIQGYKLYSDDEIIWSDESNPTADIAFDKAFKKSNRPKSAWRSSYLEAKRESMRTGKPILMWFTRTGETPSSLCKTLKRELYNRTDFKAWAKEKVVRLKVDLSGGKGPRGESGEILGDQTRRRNYAKALKKQYRVLGLPTVVMVSPSDGVMGQYRGYKRGTSDEYWENLKDSVLTHEHNYVIWKKKMSRKGYRVWTGKNGLSVFAKLARYYQNGSLVLIEPDGRKLKTTEAQLSKKDRAWIAAAKARRSQR